MVWTEAYNLATELQVSAGAPEEDGGTFSDPAAIGVVGGVAWGSHA